MLLSGSDQPASSAAAACFARCTRTSRSVVDSPPASTSATRAYNSRSSVAFQPFHTFDDTARISATVRISNKRNRSGDWMVSARSRIVFGSSMSRLNADRAEQQMMQHQPGNCLGFLGRQPKPRTDLQREFRAEFGMIAAAALADVVHNHRHVQRAAGFDLLDEFGGDRRDLRQFAALHRVEDLHRLDRMLVDGEDMIGVELHLADDAAPVGNEAAEEPGLV